MEKRIQKNLFKEDQQAISKHRLLNKTRENIHEQNYKFKKETQIIKKQPDRNSGVKEHNK